MPHHLRMISSFTYVSRYRFGRLMLTVGVFGLAVAVAGVLLDLGEDLQVVLVAGGLALPATLTALYLPLILAGKPGLRVGQEGILFGGRPLLYRRTTVFAAWDAVSEIYLFRVRHWVFVATYVGLRGTQPDVLPIPQSMPRGIAETIWHVPTDVVMASRPAYGWRVNGQALKAAAGYFAPHVPVIDLRDAVAMQAQLEHKFPHLP